MYSVRYSQWLCVSDARIKCVDYKIHCVRFGVGNVMSFCTRQTNNISEFVDCVSMRAVSHKTGKRTPKRETNHGISLMQNEKNNKTKEMSACWWGFFRSFQDCTKPTRCYCYYYLYSRGWAHLTLLPVCRLNTEWLRDCRIPMKDNICWLWSAMVTVAWGKPKKKEINTIDLACCLLFNWYKLPLKYLSIINTLIFAIIFNYLIIIITHTRKSYTPFKIYKIVRDFLRFIFVWLKY